MQPFEGSSARKVTPCPSPGSRGRSARLPRWPAGLAAPIPPRSWLHCGVAVVLPRGMAQQDGDGLLGELQGNSSCEADDDDDGEVRKQ